MLYPSLSFRSSSDTDALTYIAAVEAADGQALETNVKDAITSFILGCKSDGIWDAIKASCILAGARTLNGALVPLVGSAPTNTGFVSGDYDRRTGLKGDGSSKYLDSNRANDADPQNNNHNALYIHTAVTNSPSILLGNGVTADSGKNRMVWVSAAFHFDSRSLPNGYINVSNTSPVGFAGHSRSSAANVDFRVNLTTTNYASTSTTPLSNNIFVFSGNAGAVPVNGRFSFYSIGEALDLSLLDARLVTLMAVFSSIP